MGDNKMISCRSSSYPIHTKYYTNNSGGKNSGGNISKSMSRARNPSEMFMPPARSDASGSGRSKRANKGVGANHLLNVQFGRSVSLTSAEGMPETSSLKRRSSHHYLKSFTKSQFLRASYKFIITPYHDNSDPGLYNPDVLVSWDLVEEVIVPIKNELIDCKCPICLGMIRPVPFKM